MPIISGFRYLFGRSNIAICRRECLTLPHIRGLSTKLLTKLFVGGLSGNTNEQNLKDTFSRYGEVVDARVMINSQTGWSKGYAFVQFASEMEADVAVNQMDGRALDGKKIIVNYARLSFQDTCVDPPRAVGPPQISEENKKQEELRKKGLRKAVSSKSQASRSNVQNKMNKEKEKNMKGGKKRKSPSSLKTQTIIGEFHE